MKLPEETFLNILIYSTRVYSSGLGMMGQYLVMDCNPKDTRSQLMMASEAS